jgi:colicin import membrane protein
VTAATSHDLLLPRQPGGLVPGAALAILAHAAMLVALTTVVNWRASPPDAVSAELWSAIPQAAAPRAPEPAPRPAPPPPAPAPAPSPAPPPPPPVAEKAEPDPQIAIAQAKAERERQERAQRLEAEKLERAERQREAREQAEKARELRERARKEREAEAKAKAEADAKKREQDARKAKAEEERLAQQRQKNLERLMGQVSGSGPSTSTGTAAQSSGPSASYTGRLIAAIKPNIVFTDVVQGNPAAEVEVRAGPSGSILARRLVRSSGNKDWDEAVLRAIDRTASLPRDVDGRVPSSITMVFRPQE